MPDEEKKEIGQEEAENEAQPKKALPIKKYGIYGAIVIVMMAAAYFVTLKVVKPMLAGGDTSVEEKFEEKAETEDGGHGGSATLAEHGSGGEDESGVFLIEDLIVNPAGTGGRRFLSTSIGFELASPKATGLFEKREAIVRDALITILSSQSIPELSDFKQREKLRKLIELRVEKLLHTDAVAAVYFTEFVLQ
jgi:flagellar FliL protein